MKQIWITKAGEPDVLKVQEAPDPIVRSGEVRVRVEASGVNFADIVARMGMYADAPPLPFVPGLEVAGTIDSIGQGVSGFKEGDKVFGFTRFGGYSDLLCVPAKQMFLRLSWMSIEDGAAIPIAYLTAYVMLVVMGSVRRGSRVLIHNVSGGVGIAALDICRILGAETYGTASPQKHPFLQERGLHYAVDYRQRDYELVMQELTKGQGVDIILDPLGGKNWRKNYRLLRPTGRLICFGVSEMNRRKRRSWLDILKLLVHVPFYNPIQLMNGNKGVLGINLGNLWGEVERLQEVTRQLIDWYDAALFRPHIDRVFKFSEVADAHHYLQDRKNIGKVLLMP